MDRGWALKGKKNKIFHPNSQALNIFTQKKLRVLVRGSSLAKKKKRHVINNKILLSWNLKQTSWQSYHTYIVIGRQNM
jgi:hypothetical protein